MIFRVIAGRPVSIQDRTDFADKDWLRNQPFQLFTRQEAATLILCLVVLAYVFRDLL